MAHLKTTIGHPQTNSMAITRYLASFVDESNLNGYIFPLMFSYKTSSHQSIQNTHIFLTFVAKPNNRVCQDPTFAAGFTENPAPRNSQNDSSWLEMPGKMTKPLLPRPPTMLIGPPTCTHFKKVNWPF